MHGSRSALLVSLPVALASTLAAHLAAYALATPSPQAQEAHGYYAQLPLVGGAALAVVLAAAGWRAVRGRTGPPPAPWLFGVVPLLAFALQEHLELFSAPAILLTEPTFLVGAALQIPFGLLSWVLARAILRAADVLGALLAPPRAVRGAPLPRRLPRLAATPLTAVSGGCSQRGPPSASAFCS